MAFLDKLQEVAKTIGDKTSETMKVVGDKTNDAVEYAKQKNKINQEKNAISDIKKQMGELVWKQYHEGAECSEELKTLCESIQEHLNLIAKAEEEIKGLKNKTGEDAETVEEAVQDSAEEISQEAAEKNAEEASQETGEESASEEDHTEE